MNRLSLLVVRYGLPVIIAIAGVLLLIAGHGNEKSPASASGVVILGIALMVWMLGWLFRMSLASNADRDKEEAARDYFTEHGRWPDDVESAGADSIGSSPGGELPKGE